MKIVFPGFCFILMQPFLLRVKSRRRFAAIEDLQRIPQTGEDSSGYLLKNSLDSFKSEPADEKIRGSKRRNFKEDIATVLTERFYPVTCCTDTPDVP
jgi:hypothetical protein